MVNTVNIVMRVWDDIMPNGAKILEINSGLHYVGYVLYDDRWQKKTIYKSYIAMPKKSFTW